MNEKTKIQQFVQELLARCDDRGPLADHDSLLLSGRLRSIDGVEIVLFLEENFGIDFAEIGFDREQIDSIDAIYALAQTTTAGN